MAINKVLLRQALCDGAFSQQPQSPDPRQRAQITPGDLARVASMTDAEITLVLNAYKAQKALVLARSKDQLTKQITNIDAQIALIEPVDPVDPAE